MRGSSYMSAMPVWAFRLHGQPYIVRLIGQYAYGTGQIFLDALQTVSASLLGS